MATRISWADETWNPTAGCTMCSPGCQNCYAMAMAYRFKGTPKLEGLARKNGNGKVTWTRKVRFWESALQEPYRWKQPKRIFVGSMSDLFHADVSFEQIDRVMAVIADNPQHTFLVLTKRAERMYRYLRSRPGQLPGNDWSRNIWFGVSAENNQCAEQRVPYLWVAKDLGFTTFVSYEPALGPIQWGHNWKGMDVADYVDQITVGAESGPNGRRRPFDMQWARDTLDFCQEHGIAFFFKQGSARKSGVEPYLIEEDGSCWEWHQYPGDLTLPVQVYPDDYEVGS